MIGAAKCRCSDRRSSRSHRLLRQLLGLFFALCVTLVAHPGVAQEANVETELWSQTADQAVELLSQESASSEDLETLRTTLSEQRSAALEAQDSLRARLDTLEAELAALGEPPPEGEAPEAEEIAALRRELNERIGEARVPFVAAQVAYERADGLINEFDSVVRGRLSRQLTNLGPSPVNPKHWTAATVELSGIVETSRDGIRAELSNDFQRSRLVERLPFAFLLILGGLALQFLIKPRILRNLTGVVGQASPSSIEFVDRLPILLVRNFLPLVAVASIIFGIDQLDPRVLPDIRPSTILAPMAAVVVVAYWLGNAVFAPDFPDSAVMPVRDGKERRGRQVSVLLGFVVALTMLWRFLVANFAVSEATAAIVQFPLILAGGILLARLSTLVRAPFVPKTSEDEAEVAPTPATFIIRNGLSRFGFAVAVIAPLLALIGYLSAANALFPPTVYTFALIGGLAVIYTLFRDGIDYWLEYGAYEGSKKYRRRFRSIPLFGGFILSCLAVPVLALIWGARVSELQEVWIWLRDGISVGDVRLSVTDVLVFIFVFAIGYTITRMLQAVFRGTVLPRTDFDRGASNAIVAGIGYVGIFLAAVFAISSTGLSLGNLAIVAGALSVGIGFGLQTIVSNFVSGIILLVERPIKEGDWIEVAGFSGYVRKISVRSTMIDTFDRASVIVPNSELIAGSVLNWTHSEMTGRVIVPVGVAYGEDPRKVEAILSEIADDHPMVVRKPAPNIVFMGFGADSMDFEIRAILRDVNWMLSAKSEMNFEIVRRFAEEGIEIPYAQRDINLRNVDEAAKAFWQEKRSSET